MNSGRIRGYSTDPGAEYKKDESFAWKRMETWYDVAEIAYINVRSKLIRWPAFICGSSSPSRVHEYRLPHAIIHQRVIPGHVYTRTKQYKNL